MIMNDLPNPVIDDEAAALLNAAHEEDHKPFVESEDNPSPEPKEEPVAATVELEENEPTAEELADPANKDRPRDPITGKFIKKAVEATPSVTAPAPVQPAPVLSEFEQKKQEQKRKDQERKDTSWRAINERKEELDRRQAALEEQRRQFSQPQQQRQQPEPRQFSSQQLLDASDDFKKNAKAAFKRYQESGNEADLDEFNKNDQLADQAFQNAGQFFQIEQQEGQQIALQQHNQLWSAHMEQAVKANPDLLKKDSPIAKHMEDLLKTHGELFYMLPDGFKHAEAIAKLRLDAADAPTLREKNAALQKENERLTGLTSLSKGGPTGGPAAKKSFDSLPLEEMGAELQRMAEAEDGS